MSQSISVLDNCFIICLEGSSPAIFSLFCLCLTDSVDMHFPTPYALVLVLAVFAAPSLGAANIESACSVTLTPTNSITPNVASGYRMAVVATGLTKPRSIRFDSKGNLFVVQQGAGIVNLAFTDHGGTCLSVNKMQTVIKNSSVSLTPFLPAIDPAY